MAITIFPETADAITQAAWQSLADSHSLLGDHVVEGFELTDPTGLFVDVEPGTALIAGKEVVSSASIQNALTASDVNYVYLEADGTLTVNLTGTQPADTVFLGTATTDGSSITALSHDATTTNAAAAFCVKPAAQAFSGATLANDDDLAFAVGERQLWKFEMVARVYAATGESGAQWNIVAPSGIIRAMTNIVQSPTGAGWHTTDFSTYTHGGTTTLADSQVTVSTSGGVSATIVHLTGYIVTGSASGTVQVKWAEAVDQAGDLTVDVGTYILATRIPI